MVRARAQSLFLPLCALLLITWLLLLFPPFMLWAQGDSQITQTGNEQTGDGENGDGETHTVQVGETLSAIARLYAIPLEDLMAYNAINNPDAINIGQVLALPPGAVRQPEPAPLPIHEVQPGETLSEIAAQYNVTLNRLMLYNGLSDADAIVVGRRLRIPLVPEGDPPDPDPPSPTPTVISSIPISQTAISTVTLTVEPTDQTPVAVATETATVTATGPVTEVTPTALPTVVADVTTIGDNSDIGGGQLEKTFVQGQTAALNRRYTVRAGDTFSRIALRSGVDAEALRRLNRLDPEALGQLYVGQTLLLPATGDDLRVRRPDREYVIQAGDSLGTIAEQFELTLADLLTANRLSDPDNISIGQRLMIPQPASVETTLAQRASVVGPERNGFYYYTVQPGDTISELAQAFNSTKLAIFEYNKGTLPDQETVYTGLEIRIPYGPPTLPDRHPPVPTSGSSFLVSLSRQQCWLFHGNRVAHAWTCSTGYGDWITRVGTFAVQSKIENAESSAYRLDMPYWLGIYDVGPYENGIHGLPVEWDTGEKIWEGLIGEPATFGCAMLDDRDAAVLFNAAYIGMPIHVMH